MSDNFCDRCWRKMNKLLEDGTIEQSECSIMLELSQQFASIFDALIVEFNVKREEPLYEELNEIVTEYLVKGILLQRDLGREITAAINKARN